MNSWLSVVGLLADLVGFAIITLDVFPEYRLYRESKRCNEVHDRAFDLTTLQAPESEFDTFVHRSAKLAAVRKIEGFRSWLGLPEKVFIDEDEALDPVAIERSRQEVLEGIGKLSSEISGFRPPVGIGIALVFLGFLLQVAGAWPTASETAPSEDLMFRMSYENSESTPGG